MTTTEQISYDEVSFYSDSLELSAYLYPPADWSSGDPPRPGVVCLHGYTGMKEIYGLDVPERLASEGYFVLAPDHRGFGTSEGDRGRHRPLEQAQDTYDAITYFETVEGVDTDRIGLYGTSYGGANAIWVAAFDERVKVVVSAVGVHDGRRWLRTIRRPHEWREFQERVAESARARVKSGEPEMATVGDIMLSDPHTKRVIEEHHQQHQDYVAEYDLESAEACMRYRPEWVADKIAPRPVLFISAEKDDLVLVEEQRSCYEACGEPKKLVTIPEARHYEAYAFVDPEKAEIKLSETVDWFDEHL